MALLPNMEELHMAIKKIEATANEAISQMVGKLTHYSEGQKLRDDLRKLLDLMEKPITYSFEDKDRSGYLAAFLANDLTK